MSKTITIRRLSEDTQRVIRHRAVDHGRSFEAEIRAILDDAATERHERTNAEILFDAAAKFREAAPAGFTFPERVVEYQRDVLL